MKLNKLVEEAGLELYPICTAFYRFSFTIHLYLVNVYINGIINYSLIFTVTKRGQNRVDHPPAYNNDIWMVKDLGLDYKKINACLNVCMLFRNDHKDDEFCLGLRVSQYIKPMELECEIF